MPLLSSELVDKANEWSVLDYFNAFRPNELKQTGKTYRMIEHPSFCISLDGWLYDWKSQGIHGRGAVSYLMNVENLDYRAAVKLLTGSDVEIIHTPRSISVAYVPFCLPERNNSNTNLIRYLTSRGISREVVNHCISQQWLYESKEYAGAVLVGYNKSKQPLYIKRSDYNELIKDTTGKVENIMEYACNNHLIIPDLTNYKIVSNATFVGYNGNEPAYAAQRGMINKTEVIDGKVKNTSFRKEVSGSKKEYSFFMRDISDRSNSIHIFEAAIDAMSYATLVQLYSSDFTTKNLLSLGGAQSGKSNAFEPDKISLPPALQLFLNQHTNSKVYIHFDNDEAGQKHSTELSNKLTSLGIRSEIKLPPSGKDFNDFLKNSLDKLNHDKGLDPKFLLQQR